MNLQEEITEFKLSVELNQIVHTFHNGKYNDTVREVYDALLSLNVGVNNVEKMVRTVFEKLGGLKVERLPKRTFSEIMLVEAKALAQMQAAEAMLTSECNTLHTDGTKRGGHEFGGVQAESGLKLWEQNILESVDCSSFFSPSCCDFIRASTKLCVPGADEKSGYAGCRALGIVNKLLTGPLWRIIENVDHILVLNDIWLVFKNSIELLSKDASELIEGKVFYPEFTKKDEVFNSLFINNDLDEELNLLTIEALQIILMNFFIIIETQLSDCLPSSIFNENTEGVNKDLRVESTTVGTTNIVSERAFAYLDRLRRIKPNDNTVAVEGIILFSNNKTLRWLDDMNVEIKEIFKIAREKTPEIIKQFRKRKEEFKKNHMILLKQRKEEKERKSLKKQEEVKALTIEIQKHGGLWLNLKD
ncbi:Hypothetical predicted protein [Mytilus galloprovincialis]|uniref:Uncharacterized protein n=1 Tax=Mytilus galloprovincialis TaxID=29158 RepID=A0A8B6CEI4_MYTGA|nr:Hypothetical predicted protein [Mytilus galloprovincialis]